MIHFTIFELIKSNTATRLGIDNHPNEAEKTNLIKLVDNVLDPLREKFGRPIIVNSGFRCKKLNKAVGGTSNSQHTTGCAVDIQSVGDIHNKELFELAKTMEYDQLIHEYGTDSQPDWIHISYVSKSKNRHEILRAKKVNGKTIYTKIV